MIKVAWPLGTRIWLPGWKLGKRKWCLRIRCSWPILSGDNFSLKKLHIICLSCRVSWLGVMRGVRLMGSWLSWLRSMGWSTGLTSIWRRKRPTTNWRPSAERTRSTSRSSCRNCNNSDQAPQATQLSWGSTMRMSGWCGQTRKCWRNTSIYWRRQKSMIMVPCRNWPKTRWSIRTSWSVEKSGWETSTEHYDRWASRTTCQGRTFLRETEKSSQLYASIPSSSPQCVMNWTESCTNSEEAPTTDKPLWYFHHYPFSSQKHHQITHLPSIRQYYRDPFQR